MDIPKWNRVYSKIVSEDNTDNTDDIKPEYLYLAVPTEYASILIKLMTLLSNLGKEMIDNCNATCNGNGKNITTCWMLFQTAIEAYHIGKASEANDLIQYIENKLDIIVKEDTEQVGEFFVDENLTIKGACQANKEVKVFIDKEDYSAYEDYLLHKDNGKVFVKVDN